MMKNIENKAIMRPPISKSEVRRLEVQTGQEAPLHDWEFDGSGIKPPTVIRAKSQAEALDQYEDYLNQS